MAADFRPALIVVDVQEDFCPPDGALAVPDARSILPTINHLLTLPFVLKICTKDWHPPEHISFAENHAPPATPFTSTTTITNPLNPAETLTTLLWPTHCVQHTPGAALLPGLLSHQQSQHNEILVLEKGLDSRVEMYSAFYAPFRDPGGVCDSGLLGMLEKKGVTHVFVVGLAADYCVRYTALDARAEGFETVIVEEGTRAVDRGAWEGAVRGEVERAGVRVVGIEGEEVRRVVELGKGKREGG